MNRFSKFTRSEILALRNSLCYFYNNYWLPRSGCKIDFSEPFPLDTAYNISELIKDLDRNEQKH